MRAGVTTKILGLACIQLFGTVTSWAVEPLHPFRDALFSYPDPTAVSRDGALLDVPYSESRDIDQRDEIPERRAKQTYASILPRDPVTEGVANTPSGPVAWMKVSRTPSPVFTVVFVHGRNGDRRLGMNDWTFGGNFNRLKNLAVQNNGAYLTFDGKTLENHDAERAAHFIRQIRLEHPSSPMVLACGSMGGELCWQILAQDQPAQIDGLILLGSNTDQPRFERMWAGRRGDSLPIVIAHGTRDKVYSIEKQRAFFDWLRRQDPSYPARFIRFDDGNHGTPIRMIDWRDTLNWILSRKRP